MASTLSLPPIQTSLPLASHHDDPLRDATPKDAKSMAAQLDSFTRDPEPQRGRDGASIKREDFQYTDKQPTPDLLSPNTAFSQAAASAALQQPPGSAPSSYYNYAPPPQPSPAQPYSQSYPGPQASQQQPYTATAGGYYANPYYTGPTAPWAYSLQPNQSAPATTAPPQQPIAAPQPPQNYMPPPAAPQSQDYLAFSHAAAASLYNPALYGMHPWSYADLVSSGFNYSAGLMRPSQAPADPSINGNLSSTTNDLTSDSDFSASDATTSSRKSANQSRKVRSSSSSSLLNTGSYSSNPPPPPAAAPVQSSHTTPNSGHSTTPASARSYSGASNGNNNGGGNKEKKYICAHCGEAFARNFNLKSHISCKHMGEKPFACNCCAKTFSRKHDTARHLAARHGYSHAEATAEVNKRYPVGGGSNNTSNTSNSTSVGSTSV